MRILLTGGTGQVGRELRRALAPLGDVHAPPRSELDLADEKAIVAAVGAMNPHLIVNAGAFTDVDSAEAEPAEAMAVNGMAPGILAREAARLGAGLVHYSTDYVFDGRKSSPYVEDDATAPLNVYGASKLAGERAVRAAGGPHIVLRTAWVYASRGRNFLRAILDRARAGGRLEVVDDQFGAPTPASAVAGATARLVGSFCATGQFDRERMRECSGIFHLTAAGSTSRYEFALAILALCRLQADVRPVPSASRAGTAIRPRNSVLDNARLQRRFGIELPAWEQGLRATLGESGLAAS